MRFVYIVDCPTCRASQLPDWSGQTRLVGDDAKITSSRSIGTFDSESIV
jgi:hypothetical protein